MSAPPPPSGVVSSREKRASDVTDQHRYRYEMVRAATRRGADHQHRPAHHRVRRPGLRPARHGAGAGRRGHPCRARPGPGRRAGRHGRLRRAGGGERADHRHRHRPGPHRLHAARGGVRPEGGPARRRASTSSSRCRAAANAITVRYSIPDAPNGGGITAPLDVTVNGKDRRTHDADVAVLLALQPVPVHQRPERRPAAPRLVDHRVRVRARRHHAGAGDQQAVPARRTSTTSSGCCSAGPTGPATRCGSPSRPAAVRRGRSSTCSTPSSSAAPHVELRRGQRARSSAPTRPAGATRPAALDRAIAFAKRGAPQGLPPAGHLPGEPAHRRRRRDDRGRGQLVHDRQGPPGRADRTGAGRLGPHRRRLLRQGRGGRRQPQRAPVRLRDRGRRPRAHRHRPGQRHRRRAERLDHRRPVPAPHQGRPVVRRADDEHPGHRQRHRRPDRRRAQLPHRRHELGGGEQLHPQHRRRRPGHVVGEDRRRREHVPTTTPSRPRRWPTASRSTAAPTTPCPATSSPTRSARAARSTSARGSAPSRSPAHSGSRTTPRSAPAPTS